MDELKKIKKMYGEDFMKLCRTLFPTLLETEGRLYELLTLYFSNNSRTLCADIIKNGLEGEFKNFIYSKIDVEHPDKIILEDKTPYQLLDEAGYKLIECKTEKEIQKFKKYYKPGEELCTFEGGRLEKCHVFFAVRKDVESIRRENFDNPKREDEYGTSVMGIQFNKEGICTVSIKNRYNHRVNNPDATYGNDLDRIIPGLTQSFGRLLKARGLELNSSNIEEFEIPSYVVANDGKYYKFNMEINGTYYCPGNVVIKNGEVHKIENPEKQVLMDYFILDLENKTMQLYDQNVNDCFTDGLHNIEKTEIVKDKEKGTRIITIHKKGQDQPIITEIDQDNQIIGYENSSITHIGDDCLRHNRSLTQLEMPNVTKVGAYFLASNECLTQLEMSSLKEAGDWFLEANRGLTQLEMPKATKVGKNFLNSNEGLTQLKMPNVTQVGHNFLNSNEGLTQLEMPNVTKVGAYFLSSNEGLTQLEMPSLNEAGDCFLEANRNLRKLKAPSLTQVDDHFLSSNEGLTQLEMPYIKEHTDRLRKIIKKNRIKTILDRDSELNETEVDESKFAQIYDKAKGRIREVVLKIKSFFHAKSNDRNDKENDETIK